MGFFENRRRKKAMEAAIGVVLPLDGRQVQYITRREPDEHGNMTDVVVGKGGRIWIHEDEVRLSDADREVYACSFVDVEAGELMSGDGLLLKGPNRLNGDRPETVVAHCLYFR